MTTPVILTAELPRPDRETLRQLVEAVCTLRPDADVVAVVCAINLGFAAGARLAAREGAPV